MQGTKNVYNKQMSLIQNTQTNVLHADVLVAGSVVETVETVTGTTALNPDVSLSLVSGTTHSLGNSTQPVGFEKIVINTNTTGAISRIFTQQVPGVISSNNVNFSQRAEFRALEYYPEGNTMFVGGKFVQVEGVAVSNIAAYNFTTNTWSSLGTGVTGTNAQVNTLLLKGTRLYVGGSFTAVTTGGVPLVNTGYIAYWDLAGNTWNAVGTGLTGGDCNFLYTTSAYPNDVFATGSFSLAGGVANTLRIARFNETGNTWNALGTGLVGAGQGILYVNSLFVVVGGFQNVGTTGAGGVVNTNYLALWDQAGGAWYGYGANQFFSSINAITEFDANHILVSGVFTQIGTVAFNRCVKIPKASITTAGSLTFTQFAPITVSSQNSFFKDASGTLFACALLNSVNGFEQLTLPSSDMLSIAWLCFYDNVSESWAPVFGGSISSLLVIRPTNNPNVYWVGGTGFVNVDSVVGGINGMVALDTSKITRITGLFTNNGFTKTTMQMLYPKQAATLLKVDALGWMVKGTSSGLGYVGAGQTPVWFY